MSSVNIFINKLEPFKFTFALINVQINMATENSQYDYSILGLDNVNQNVIKECILLNLDRRCIVYHLDAISVPFYLSNSDVETFLKEYIVVDLRSNSIKIPDTIYGNQRNISYSLYNNIDTYSIGALKNAKYEESNSELSKIFYVRKDVDQSIVQSLSNYKNCNIFLIAHLPDYLMMFLRFLPTEGSQLYSSRDTDCRILPREEAAVKEWLESDKNLHVMRDHPHHQFEILGGLWDYRKCGKLDNIRFKIKDWLLQHEGYPFNNRDADQKFLKESIYPLFRNDILAHDEFYGKPHEERRKFPTKREELEFVGMYVYADESRSEQHHLILQKSLRS